MPLNTEPVIIGSQAFFIREGQAITLPSAGAASKTLRPGPTELTWIPLGALLSVGEDGSPEEVKAYAPSPGHLEVSAVFQIKFQRKITLKTNEFGPMALELQKRSAPLTSGSTSATPNAQVQKLGWLKVVRHNQADGLIYTDYCWGALRFDGEALDDPTQIRESTFVFDVFKCDLNTVTIGT